MTSRRNSSNSLWMKPYKHIHLFNTPLEPFGKFIWKVLFPSGSPVPNYCYNHVQRFSCLRDTVFLGTHTKMWSSLCNGRDLSSFLNLSHNECEIVGAIHSTKISGNLGLKLIGSVRSKWKSSKKRVHFLRWTASVGPVRSKLTVQFDLFDQFVNPSTSLFVTFHRCYVQ